MVRDGPRGDSPYAVLWRQGLDCMRGDRTMSGVVGWVAAVGCQRPTIAKASAKQRPYDAPCVLSIAHARMHFLFRKYEYGL